MENRIIFKEYKRLADIPRQGKFDSVKFKKLAREVRKILEEEREYAAKTCDRENRWWKSNS